MQAGIAAAIEPGSLLLADTRRQLSVLQLPLLTDAELKLLRGVVDASGAGAL